MCFVMSIKFMKSIYLDRRFTSLHQWIRIRIASDEWWSNKYLCIITTAFTACKFFSRVIMSQNYIVRKCRFIQNIKNWIMFLYFRFDIDIIFITPNISTMTWILLFTYFYNGRRIKSICMCLICTIPFLNKISIHIIL